VVDARRDQSENGLEVGVLLHHLVRVDQVPDTAASCNASVG
jgi:hypothetical protein